LRRSQEGRVRSRGARWAGSTFRGERTKESGRAGVPLVKGGMPLALITGAGVRVGRAVALGLARAGYDLLLHVNQSIAGAQAVALEARALGRTAEVLVADLSQGAGVDQLAARVLAQYGVLDVLINNAGLFEKVPFGAITRAQYARMQAVNVEAPFFLTQGLLPALQRSRSAVVINLTDVAGERPVRGYAHYSVSKAGLIMLTRALAIELAPGIRVNGVSPGTVLFPEDFPEDQRAGIRRRIPMGVEGTAEDIARTVVFLCTDAPYITGQILAVDGGRSSVL